MGGEIGANDAIRAAAIVDYDLLAEPLGELDAEEAHQQIVAPSGRKRNDDADRLIREIPGGWMVGCAGGRQRDDG